MGVKSEQKKTDGLLKRSHLMWRAAYVSMKAIKTGFFKKGENQ